MCLITYHIDCSVDPIEACVVQIRGITVLDHVHKGQAKLGAFSYRNDAGVVGINLKCLMRDGSTVQDSIERNSSIDCPDLYVSNIILLKSSRGGKSSESIFL